MFLIFLNDMYICCLYEAKLQYETFDDSFGEGDWVLTVFTALSTVSFPWDIFFLNTTKYWKFCVVGFDCTLQNTYCPQ